MKQEEELKSGLDMKVLYVETDVNTHCEIRKRAAIRNISIKMWVLRAIQRAILEEDKRK